MMKAGDRVVVYEDPISCRKIEGRATLIHQDGDRSHNGSEQWLVHFNGDDDGDNFERVINVRGEIRGTIAAYIQGKDSPSAHDLQCFVGMIETGEALYDDFVAVGGKELETAVCETREASLQAPRCGVRPTR